MPVVGTGVMLTEDDVRTLKDVQSMPFITGPSLIEPETVEQALYRIALAKGLPEIPGWYGLDQTQKPPVITRWEEP